MTESTMAERPFYDIVRDASPEAHELAAALRERIKSFRHERPEITNKEVADAVKLVSLRATVG